MNFKSFYFQKFLIFLLLLSLSICFKIDSSFQGPYDFDPLIVQNSTPATISLYERLKGLYGKYVISGQTTKQFSSVKQAVGYTPVIQGFDMQNYSPHNPWFNWQPYDDGTIDNAIKWYEGTNKKGIVSFQWHWFSPMGGNLRTSTFYTNNTDFNLSKALQDETNENNATLRDIDAIAVQLKRLQSANIPILWRPLHEAGGGWFWWGSKTSKQAIRLYDIIQKRLIVYHKINNLIWIWSTPQPSWYPGNKKLDILGFDSYPSSYNYTCNDFYFKQLMKLTQYNKMVSLSQNGPIPDFPTCLKNNITWGYFMTWAEFFTNANSLDHNKAIFNSNVVVKLEQL